MYKVIVAITTYNLENYISEALDSVICQKTNFNFLIRIADDCSTDRTPSILKEYAEKYPDKIEVLYSDKNLGSLANSNRLLDRIDCEYFCFLDGDDYWVTTTRLQEAVDFLDKNNDYTIYGGNTIFQKNGILSGRYLKKNIKNTYTINDYINHNVGLVHTSALVLRNVVYKHGIPQSYKDNEYTELNCAYRGELIRYIEHLRVGKMYIANKDLSVYRIHEKGIWQGKSQLRRDIENIISDLVFCQLFPECSTRFSISYVNSISLFGEKYLSRYNILNQTEKDEIKKLLGVIDKLDCNIRSQQSRTYTVLDNIVLVLYKFNRRIAIKLRTFLVLRECWYRFI